MDEITIDEARIYTKSRSTREKTMLTQNKKTKKNHSINSTCNATPNTQPHIHRKIKWKNQENYTMRKKRTERNASNNRRRSLALQVVEDTIDATCDSASATANLGLEEWRKKGKKRSRKKFSRSRIPMCELNASEKSERNDSLKWTTTRRANYSCVWTWNERKNRSSRGKCG